MLSPASLPSPELGQGPGVNAGLMKVGEGQGWRTEPPGQRKDHYDCVYPCSIPPATPSCAACAPKPRPGAPLPPHRCRCSAAAVPAEVLVPALRVVRWRWEDGNGEQSGDGGVTRHPRRWTGMGGGDVKAPAWLVA